jgi:hypothetical protein
MGDTVVWLYDYKQYAILVQVNAYYSVVQWDEYGTTIQIEVANDDYKIIGTDDDDY